MAELEDCAISRPPCWRRSRPNLTIVLKEEPKTISELTMTVFNQVLMRNIKEMEFKAHGFKIS